MSYDSFEQMSQTAQVHFSVHIVVHLYLCAGITTRINVNVQISCRVPTVSAKLTKWNVTAAFLATITLLMKLTP